MKKQGETKKVEKEDQVFDEFKGVKRSIKKDMDVISYVFKLEPANAIKDIGANPKRPMPSPFPHCHVYRTIDSSGKKPKKSTYAIGHCHAVTVTVNDKGEFEFHCSPPIQTKKNEKLMIIDNHTHEMRHVDHQQIEIRKFNPEAFKSFNTGLDQNIKDDLPSLKR